MIPTAKAAAHRDDALTFFSMVNRPFPGKIVSKRQKTLSLRAGHLQSFFPAFAEQAAAPKRLPPRPYFSLRDAPRYFRRWPSLSQYKRKPIWLGYERSLRTHTSSLITTAHSGRCALAGKTEQPRPFAVHHHCCTVNYGQQLFDRKRRVFDPNTSLLQNGIRIEIAIFPLIATRHHGFNL
jgi:hypothetical protein